MKDILQDKMELAQRDISSQYYEIIQKDFHKGKAIKRLQERLGVTQKKPYVLVMVKMILSCFKHQTLQLQ